MRFNEISVGQELVYRSYKNASGTRVKVLEVGSFTRSVFNSGRSWGTHNVATKGARVQQLDSEGMPAVRTMRLACAACSGQGSTSLHGGLGASMSVLCPHCDGEGDVQRTAVALPFWVPSAKLDGTWAALAALLASRAQAQRQRAKQVQMLQDTAPALQARVRAVEGFERVYVSPYNGGVTLTRKQLVQLLDLADVAEAAETAANETSCATARGIAGAS